MFSRSCQLACTQYLADLLTLVNCQAGHTGTFSCFHVPVYSPTPLSASSLYLPSCPFCHPIPFPYLFPFLSSPCPIPQIQLGSPGSAVKSSRSVSGQSPAAKRILVQQKQKKNWALACGAGLTALQNE